MTNHHRMRQTARLKLLQDPANAQHMLMTEWPPRSRTELARIGKLLPCLNILMGPRNELLYMDARVHSLLEHLQQRARRYSVQKAWTATAPNGRSVEMPLNSSAAIAFKAMVDDAGGAYERPMLALIDSQLRPGDVFVDVGAHVGYVSAMAATTGATVFAIEFQRELIPLIDQVATLNAFDLLRPLNVAASADAGLSVAVRGHLSPGQKLESALSKQLLGTDPASILND